MKKRLIALVFALFLCVGAADPTSVPEGVEPLRQGSRGDPVLRLQIRLLELGYLHDRLDGQYGLRTARAVNAFQKQAGLRVDGVAGAETQAEIFGELAREARVVVSPSGRRYHARANCRGLTLAASVRESNYSEISESRTPCIICYGRFALRVAEERRSARRADPQAVSPSPGTTVSPPPNRTSSP